MNNRYLKLLQLLLRIVLGAIFVYAAVSKIADPAKFANDAAAYRLLPLFMVNVFAIVFPYFEFLIGAGLLLGFWLDTVSSLTTMLIVVFLVAALSAMARGLSIECGCFTLSSHGKVGWDLIARDLIMLCMAWVLLSQSWFRQPDKKPG